jgi:hypothetical protein
VAIKVDRVVIVTDGKVSGAQELEVGLAMIFKEYLENIWVYKQAKYGPNNISGMGKSGLHARMQDKLERLKRFTAGIAQHVDDSGEGEEDAWFDTMAYAAFGLMLHRGLWPQPSRWQRLVTLVKMNISLIGEILWTRNKQ